MLQHRLGDEVQLAGRDGRRLDCARVPVEAHHELGPVECGCAHHDSVEVVGEPLYLHQALPAAARTAVEVRAMGALAVVAIDDLLRGRGGHMDGAEPEVDDPLVVVQRPRGVEGSADGTSALVARVSGRGRVVQGKAGRCVRDESDVSAAALMEQLAVPVAGKLHRETDRAGTDDAHHHAMLRQRAGGHPVCAGDLGLGQG